MANVIDVSSLQTFSDSDLLTIYRYILATGGFRQEYSVNGRSFRAPDQDACIKTIAWLEQRIQDDANLQSGEGGNVVVVTFDQPT